MKTKAVPGGSPSDLRHPEPLAFAAIDAARKVEDDRERLKIHRILLTETLRRLRSGRTLERSHGVIHPEVTAIVRDALRLTDLVFPGSAAKRAEVEGEEAAGDEPAKEPSAGAKALAAVVARTSAAAVARRLISAGIAFAESDTARGSGGAEMVRAWASGERGPLFSSRDAIAVALGIPSDSWGDP
jgi:hypothetical protein